MRKEPIFIPYSILNPSSCKYQVNMKNDVIRHLLAVYKRENKIPYYSPVSDKERAYFERIIISSGIYDTDNMVVALEKFKRAEACIKRGYTHEDVIALKNKILNKEVI